MIPTFTKLNLDWNAEPNAPYPEAHWSGENLVLKFLMNSMQFPRFEEDDVGELTFTNCTRYRFGMINDEGWYRGQCRFSELAPAWGEFYEVSGNLLLDQIPGDWNVRTSPLGSNKHFLFYFRDAEFECDADSWTVKTIRSQSDSPSHSPSA